MRLAIRVLSAALLAVATVTTAFGQEPAPQPPFVERVEVRVRSVLVFITDPKGKPLAAPPAASQLRVIENGAPVEIVAVEPARSANATAAR